MNEKKYSIREWSDEDKPREKLAQLGEFAVSDVELLAIILRAGTPEKSAVELAREILLGFDGKITALANASIEELTTFNGVGHAKAVSIKAALELGRRCQLTSLEQTKQITSSADAFQLIQRDLCHQEHEECWAAFLNQANRLISKGRMSSGGMAATVVDIRTILRKALERKAKSIILFHNHPSGNLKPSQADINITRKLHESCKLMDMKLLDHLIVTPKAYYSLRDEGHF